MFKKKHASLALPRTLSLQETFKSKKRTSLKNDNPLSIVNIPSKTTIPMDKYYTNEGHQLLASYYLKRNQVQNHIIKGSLHKISEKDVDDLIKSYEGVSTPVYETLSYQELNLSSHECKLLAKLLKADTVTNIRNLKLAKNHLFGHSLKIIIESMQKNTTVKVLDLSYNHLTDNEAKWIGKLLKKNNSIKEIYLAYNRIGSDGANYISKALMINNSVERLSLESNQLNSTGGIRMANMLKVNKSIKYIHLGSNNLQLDAIKDISESLKVNDKLVSLSLDINTISSEGAKSLGESLEVNQTLTHLYIPRNDIGHEGLKYLCQSLHKNSSLIYLDLEFNCIGNESTEGVSALGDLLENHNVPRAINLSQNVFRDEGCERLFKGFHKNTSLESIILSRCGIGLDGINAIAQSLKLNSGLQNISLNRNPDMGADGHLVLADALKLNHTLKGIQLDYNFAEWEIISKSIQQSLARNHLLQKECYNTACNILKASRVLLNPILDQQLPSCSTSPLMSPMMSPLMSPLMSPNVMIPMMTITPLSSPSPSPRQSVQWLKKKQNSLKKEFTKLPFEIQEHIIAYLDTKNVLTKDQILEIVDFSMKRSTLGYSREEFLKKALSAYHPSAVDIRLWPTESTDVEFSSSERF